jgi:phosphoribosylformimino-5-aminoimidazole carboxamide ribotide isomerase
MKDDRNLTAERRRTIEVIGVLDIAGGRAVHARAGQRDRYRPVSRVAGDSIANGDPRAVAGAYVDRLGIRTLYVADLDAIAGGLPQYDVIGRLSALGIPLSVDAGVTTLGAGRRLLESGASRVVVGLETLPSFEVLDGIAEGLGGGRVAFSLDLRDGSPILSPSCIESAGSADSDQLAARAAHAGIGALIVIDLARVGMGRGIDLVRIGAIRRAAPDRDLIAGGGIRHGEDLTRASRAGCDAALVATALHSGRIGRDDIEACGQALRSV